MVLCVLAAVVFGILGIFSAKYRRLAREAFGCTFRMATLRPCSTNFDQKMKSKITGRLMSRFPSAAKVVYNNFKLLSWVFVVLFFASLFFTGRTAYNLARYGSCDPHSNSCIFNLHGGVSCGSQHCAENGCTCGEGEANCTYPDYAACGGECGCNKAACG